MTVTTVKIFNHFFPVVHIMFIHDDIDDMMTNKDDDCQNGRCISCNSQKQEFIMIGSRKDLTLKKLRKIYSDLWQI